MVFQASGTRQYFLGIAGQQSGPFSDAEVLEKIRSREVPSDALVWYEGLPEWQAINTIEFFKEAFATAPEVPPDAVNVAVNTAPAPAPEPQSKESTPRPAKAKPPGSASAQPVTSFADGESTSAVLVNGGIGSDGGENRFKIMGAVLAAVFVLGLIGFYLYLHSLASQSPDEIARSEIKLPKVPQLTINDREIALRKANTEMLAHPDTSLNELRKLVIAKADDRVGKEALGMLLQYYRQNQRPMDAGRLMMDLRRPQEAYQFFRQNAAIPSQVQVELAAYQGFQQATDPAQKRQMLIDDIELLIQPLDKMDIAMERIRLFAKLFPNTPNPYGYYLKTTDEKIADIFNKISGSFVRSLLAFATSEFPQMHLEGMPVVEVHREKDQYRIAARYKGKVRLQRDLLEDIHFSFWMIDGNWVVVDTNLTQERQIWSHRNRVRYASKLLSADEMLKYEQAVFKTQFPDAGFHEVGSALKSRQLRREE